MRHRRYFSFIFLILTVGITTYVAFRYLIQLPPWLVALLLMTVTSFYLWFVMLPSLRKYQSMNAQQLSSERLVILGEAAATIAHEITNPVTYVDSNLSGLADDLAAYNEFIGALDKASDHLDIRDPFYQDALKAYQSLDIANICENAPKRLRDSIEGIQRIERIVNDLSALGGHSLTDMRLADINSELPQVFNDVRGRLPEAVTLSTSLINVPVFPCHPSRIAQVVFNMLNNALTALNDGPGRVSVKQYLDGPNLVIDITDDGCGMPLEVTSRIFEPFFTTCEAGKGTGIGLALCYKLIREHNGDIDVMSREGRGTTFTLTIPIQHGEQTHAD